MKCPLFTIMDKRIQQGEESDYCECLKEECAWWDKVGQTCVALSINFELRLLVGAAGMVADKMPPERR